LLPTVGTMSRYAQQMTGGRLSDYVFYYLGLGDTPQKEKKKRKSGHNTRRKKKRRGTKKRR
jgi:hypothetical protein